MILRKKQLLFSYAAKFYIEFLRRPSGMKFMIKYLYLYLFLKKIQLLPNVICQLLLLTLILLRWSIGWAPNNAIKWQIGFNLAFEGLIE